MMDFFDAFDKEICKINITNANKDSVLDTIADCASKSKKICGLTKESILAKLKEREEECTTGFGDGIAIPHARLKGLDNFIVLLLTSNAGVDFDALDGQKSTILFAILAPEEKAGEHIKMLAAISKMLMTGNIKNDLLACTTTDQIFKTLQNAAKS